MSHRSNIRIGGNPSAESGVSGQLEQMSHLSNIRIGGDPNRFYFELGRKYEKTRQELFDYLLRANHASEGLDNARRRGSGTHRELIEHYKKSVILNLQEALGEYTVLESIVQQYSSSLLQADVAYVSKRIDAVSKKVKKQIP